jgi:hypothetical protein
MNKLHPKFSLKVTSSMKPMMIAEKKNLFASTSKHYVISIDSPEVDDGHQDPAYHGCIGRLRSNFAGNEYFIYDAGLNQKDVKSSSADR